MTRRGRAVAVLGGAVTLAVLAGFCLSVGWSRTLREEAKLLLLDVLTLGRAGDRPRLFLEGTEFDWGEQLRGAVVSHVFPVRNLGRRPLLLAELRDC